MSLSKIVQPKFALLLFLPYLLFYLVVTTVVAYNVNAMLREDREKAAHNMEMRQLQRERAAEEAEKLKKEEEARLRKEAIEGPAWKKEGWFVCKKSRAWKEFVKEHEDEEPFKTYYKLLPQELEEIEDICTREKLAAGAKYNAAHDKAVASPVFRQERGAAITKYEEAYAAWEQKKAAVEREYQAQKAAFEKEMDDAQEIIRERDLRIEEIRAKEAKESRAKFNETPMILWVVGFFLVSIGGFFSWYAAPFVIVLLLLLRQRQYNATHFEIDGQGVHKKYSFIRSSHESLRFGNIQEVRIMQNIFQRWCGVATLFVCSNAPRNFNPQYGPGKPSGIQLINIEQYQEIYELIMARMEGRI